MEMMVLGEIGVYITRRQNTVTEYIDTCPIMDLCLAADRKPGLHLSRRWWEHPDLDILGTRSGHASVEGGYRGGRIGYEGRQRLG